LDCQKSGTEFLDYLETLVKPPTSSGPLRNVRASIKFQWVQHKIEDFASKLDQLRSALTLAAIVALRTSSHTDTEEIHVELTRLHKEVQAQGSDNAELHKTMQRLLHIIQGQTGPRLDQIQTQILKCLTEINSLQEKYIEPRGRAILLWLSFRQMSWRYEAVPLAYQKTFEWIFEDQTSATNWTDFVAHLAGEDVVEPYFINGKAGSGKSTLMKFIVGHSKTMNALRQWARKGELLVVNFFFWNLGTTLQKTHVGMLRSLLHDILEKYPELIPAVFPSIYQNWKASEADIEPSYVEVKRAFKLLIEKSSSFLQLCLFIDGIDELEGDHKDVSRFLYSLASPGVKLVVSSRPINASLHVFSGCPFLKLQDLTRRDMDIFVEGELSSHKSMIELSNHYPQEAKELVAGLVNKAEGVFLWVTLVVRLLVDGLEEGDDIEDLRRIFESLPKDLRDLYRHMMSRMTPEYRTQGAEIFQMFHMWNLSIEGESLPVIIIHFAMQNPSKAFNIPVAPLDFERYSQLNRNAAARIRSRCCGLLEVQKVWFDQRSPRPRTEISDTIYVSHSNGHSWNIHYLHRTVAEFLLSVDVWSEIRATLNTLEFDPIQHLMSACLSMVKIGGEFSTGLYPLASIAAAFCRRATHFSDQKIIEYISAIDQAMNEHQTTNKGSQMIDSSDCETHWSASGISSMKLTKGNAVKELSKSASILTFAACQGLVRYLRTFYGRQATDYDSRVAMVIYALRSWQDKSFRKRVPLPDRIDTLLFLLKHVAKPEDYGCEDSLWNIAWNDVIPKLPENSDDYTQLLGAFFTTAQCPLELCIKFRPTQKVMNCTRSLQNNRDPEIKNLGHMMMRIILEPTSSWNV
jgi:hypothetical protein